MGRAAAPAYGRAVKLAPAHRLYGLGAVLLVSLAICAHNFDFRGSPAFLAASAVAGIAYLLAIRELFVTPGIPKRAIIFCLALAAVWHVLFLRVSPRA